MNFNLITIQAIEALAKIEGVDEETIFDQLRAESHSTMSKIFRLICAAMAEAEAEKKH